MFSPTTRRSSSMPTDTSSPDHTAKALTKFVKEASPPQHNVTKARRRFSLILTSSSPVLDLKAGLEREEDPFFKIVKAVSFFASNEVLPLLAKEKYLPVAHTTLDGFSHLITARYPSVDIAEKPETLVNAIQHLKNRAWYNTALQEDSSNQLQQHFLAIEALLIQPNFVPPSEGSKSSDTSPTRKPVWHYFLPSTYLQHSEEESTLQKLAEIPIQMSLEDKANNPDETQKAIMMRRLIQKIHTGGKSKDRLKWGILTPQELLFAYPFLVDSSTLFKQLRICLQNDQLPSSQKETLLDFCLLFLGDREWTDTLLLNDRETFDQIAANLKDESYQSKKDQFLRLVADHDFSSPQPKVQRAFANHHWEIIQLQEEDNAAQVLELSQEISTLIARLFVEVPLYEWGRYRSQQPEKTPHLSRLIEASNSLSSFVTKQILVENSDPATWTHRYSFFVAIAWKCFEKGDFFNTMSIYTALQQTWLTRVIQLKGDTLEEFKKLEAFCSVNNNFGQLRAAKKKTRIPCIPLLLHDLTSIQESELIILNKNISKPEYSIEILKDLQEKMKEIHDWKEKIQLTEAKYSFLQLQILATPNNTADLETKIKSKFPRSRSLPTIRGSQLKHPMQGGHTYRT